MYSTIRPVQRNIPVLEQIHPTTNTHTHPKCTHILNTHTIYITSPPCHPPPVDDTHTQGSHLGNHGRSDNKAPLDELVGLITQDLAILASAGL